MIYALQPLAAMLNANDTLIINPMCQGTYNYATVLDVDLSNPDRGAAINQIKETYIKTGVDPEGNTPAESVKDTLDLLIKEGLKPTSELATADPSVEYWLVMLTDGAFDGKNATYCADTIYSAVKDYQTLNSVYLSFGSGQYVVDLVTDDNANGSLKKLKNECKFTPYKATTENLIPTVQQIVNQMSGCYGMDDSSFSVTGNKVTIPLDGLGFALNNVTVIAQNCDAVINKATYSNGTISLANKSVLQGITRTHSGGNFVVKDGYSAVIEGNPYLSGGTIEVEFSAPVSDVLVLAEPAITLEPILQRKDGGNWVDTDEAYINANMRPDDEIRVGYKAIEQANKTVLDLNSVFRGDVSFEVKYAGASYEDDDKDSFIIPAGGLKKGANELSLFVSVLDDTYTLSLSINCVVEEKPTDFRIVSDYVGQIDQASAKAESKYTVYFRNKPLDEKAKLDGFTIEPTVTDEDGNSVPATYTVGDDGKVTVTTSLTSGAYGAYVESLKVTSHESTERTVVDTYYYNPTAIAVAVTKGDGMTLSEHQLAHNDKPVKFELTADGKPLSFDSKIVDYTLTFEGKDVSGKATVSGNEITYVPLADDLNSGVTAGARKVTLSVSIKNNSGLSESASASLTVTPSVYTIERVETGSATLKRFKINASGAGAGFRFYRDGESLSEDELNAMLENGDIVIDGGAIANNPFLPTKMVVSVESVDGIPTVKAKIERDCIAMLSFFAEMGIIDGEKKITASFRDQTAESKLFVPKEPVGYTIRIVVVLVILWILLWIIGFTNSKNFPTGTFVTINMYGQAANNVNISVAPVNMTFKDKWLWHIKRLFGPVIFAHQKTPKNTDYDGMILTYVGKGIRKTLHVQFSSGVFETRVTNIEGLSKINEIIETCQNPEYMGEDVDVRATVGALRDTYETIEGTYLPEDEPTVFDSSTVYASVMKNNIVMLRFFVPKNNS